MKIFVFLNNEISSILELQRKDTEDKKKVYPTLVKLKEKNDKMHHSQFFLI